MLRIVAIALGLLASANAAAGVVPAHPVSGVSSIDIADYHACLVANSGVQCWGSQYVTLVGGTPTLSNSMSPRVIPGLESGIAAIAAGGSHDCVLTSAGGVKCWGSDSAGALSGVASTAWPPPLAGPTDVPGLSSGVVAITAGYSHTCALMADKRVKCWGANYSGQLGNGNTTLTGGVVDVVGLNGDVTTISAAGAQTCVAIATGGVKCWGNQFVTTNPTPTAVSGLDDVVTALAAGMWHACALTAAGGVKCWGTNVGQLGDGTLNSSSKAIDVVGLASGVVGIGVGSYHSCALMASGAVKCWGDNSGGQLGDGSPANHYTPVDVAPFGTAISLNGGGWSTCAVTSDRSAWCWGWYNPGNGRPFPEALPVQVGVFTPQSITFTTTGVRDVAASPYALNGAASSGLPITYSVFPADVCTLSGNSIVAHEIGYCSIWATQNGDSEYEYAAPVYTSLFLMGTAPGAKARLVNLSARARVGKGDDALIGGFIIDGPTCSNVEWQDGPYKAVMTRARGPSLVTAQVSGTLDDPTLELRGRYMWAENDNWQQYASPAFNDFVASTGFALSDPRESMVYASACTGATTAIVRGASQGEGVGIVDIFEMSAAPLPFRNLSARARVGTGEDVLIAGFVIRGEGTRRIVVNAAGASLANYGVPGALANPTLTLVRMSDNTVIGFNDDWQIQANAGDVAAIQATGLQPNHPNEPAIIADLPAGAYTAIVAGAQNTTGVALVGVFAVP